MTRYIERAENVARFIDVNQNLLPDLPSGLVQQWQPLVDITGDREPFAERYGEASQENVIEFLTFDQENPNSVLSCLQAARENARSIREIISSEMWSELNDFYLNVRDPSARSQAANSPSEFFRQVKRRSHLFEGVANATMSHGDAWHFSRIGRMLERADKTTRILDVKYFLLLPEAAAVGSPVDDVHWSAVLRAASGFEMYRKQHRRFEANTIFSFLILDRDFPRAVHYCSGKAEQSMHYLTGSRDGSFENPAEQSLGRLVAELDYSDSSEILRQGMHEYLDDLQLRLNQIGEQFNEVFFSW
jgi:uncharacterized alpha-E superfamily protein